MSEKSSIRQLQSTHIGAAGRGRFQPGNNETQAIIKAAMGIAEISTGVMNKAAQEDSEEQQARAWQNQQTSTKATRAGTRAWALVKTQQGLDKNAADARLVAIHGDKKRKEFSDYLAQRNTALLKDIQDMMPEGYEIIEDTDYLATFNVMAAQSDRAVRAQYDAELGKREVIQRVKTFQDGIHKIVETDDFNTDSLNVQLNSFATGLNMTTREAAIVDYAKKDGKQGRIKLLNYLRTFHLKDADGKESERSVWDNNPELSAAYERAVDVSAVADSAAIAEHKLKVEKEFQRDILDDDVDFITARRNLISKNLKFKIEHPGLRAGKHSTSVVDAFSRSNESTRRAIGMARAMTISFKKYSQNLDWDALVVAYEKNAQDWMQDLSWKEMIREEGRLTIAQRKKQILRGYAAMQMRGVNALQTEGVPSWITHQALANAVKGEFINEATARLKKDEVTDKTQIQEALALANKQSLEAIFGLDKPDSSTDNQVRPLATLGEKAFDAKGNMKPEVTGAIETLLFIPPATLEKWYPGETGRRLFLLTEAYNAGTTNREAIALSQKAAKIKLTDGDKKDIATEAPGIAYSIMATKWSLDMGFTGATLRLQDNVILDVERRLSKYRSWGLGMEAAIDLTIKVMKGNVNFLAMEVEGLLPMDSRMMVSGGNLDESISLAFNERVPTDGREIFARAVGLIKESLVDPKSIFNNSESYNLVVDNERNKAHFVDPVLNTSTQSFYLSDTIAIAKKLREAKLEKGTISTSEFFSQLSGLIDGQRQAELDEERKANIELIEKFLGGNRSTPEATRLRAKDARNRETEARLAAFSGNK